MGWCAYAKLHSGHWAGGVRFWQDLHPWAFSQMPTLHSKHPGTTYSCPAYRSSSHPSHHYSPSCRHTQGCPCSNRAHSGNGRYIWCRRRHSLFMGEDTAQGNRSFGSKTPGGTPHPSGPHLSHPCPLSFQTGYRFSTFWEILPRLNTQET